MKNKLDFICSQFRDEEINVKFFDKNNKEIPKEQVEVVKVTSGEDKGRVIYLKNS